MSHRKLIVARLNAEQTEPVARLFAESDRGDLPAMLGVTRRTLFTFHDLYFHLVESEQDVAGPLSEVREHPLYRSIDEGLASYVRPYHPSWRGPADAMATLFYEWRRP